MYIVHGIPLKAAHLFSDSFECFHLLCLVLLHVHVHSAKLPECTRTLMLAEGWKRHGL